MAPVCRSETPTTTPWSSSARLVREVTAGRRPAPRGAPGNALRVGAGGSPRGPSVEFWRYPVLAQVGEGGCGARRWLVDRHPTYAGATEDASVVASSPTCGEDGGRRR
jgi:hypothetical protein